ncbi:hypothetical protein BV898_08251 [Hypsibius exemplaris]|uniref:Uncharacterized protein n=1 Tax=Hypsibius exemplaris TaxID=2072580 RepID=A0A1W0WR47_HYPEX|nr:hypothetical protein BV898_08251 [Hypsibius exemplaris]
MLVLLHQRLHPLLGSLWISSGNLVLHGNAQSGGHHTRSLHTHWGADLISDWSETFQWNIRLLMNLICLLDLF